MKKLALICLIVVGLLFTLSGCDEILEELYPDFAAGAEGGGVEFVVKIAVRPDITNESDFRQGRPIIVQLVPFRNVGSDEDFIDWDLVEQAELREPDFYYDPEFDLSVAKVSFFVYDNSRYRIIAYFDRNEDYMFNPGELSTMAWAGSEQWFDPGWPFEKFEWDLQWGINEGLMGLESYDPPEGPIRTRATLDFGTNIFQQDQWLMGKLTEGQTDTGENQPPWANFWVQEKRALNFPLNVDAGGSGDDDGWIVEYRWDFGDGSGTRIESQPWTNYNYNDPGFYDITLTVEDNRGGVAQTTKRVEIVDIGGIPQDPVVRINIPNRVITGIEVWIDGWSSYDLDGYIIHDSMIWTLTPPNSGESIIFSNTGGFPFIFDEPGLWQIELRLEDNEGRLNSKVKNVDVLTGSGGNEPPSVSLFSDTDTIVVSLDEDDANWVYLWTEDFDVDGWIAKTEWTFDDDFDEFGDPIVYDLGPSAWWFWTTTGDKKVTVTVTDNEGAQDSANIIIRVVEDIIIEELQPGDPYTYNVLLQGLSKHPYYLPEGIEVRARIENDDFTEVVSTYGETITIDSNGEALIQLTPPSNVGYDNSDWLVIEIDADNSGTFEDDSDLIVEYPIFLRNIDLDGTNTFYCYILGDEFYTYAKKKGHSATGDRKSVV